MALPRIRQLVFASRSQDDIERLRHILDLGDGFVDEGVGVFGLTNGVFAIGDQFLEVVVPVQDNTAAGRFLDRSDGVGGYMVILQTEDLASVRTRADARGIRRVWDIDVEDISASHLHPADIGAAIVSIDEARPAGAWRWGGPKWQDNARPGALWNIEISARDPRALSSKWANVLGLDAVGVGHDIWEITLSQGLIRVSPGERDAVLEYQIAHPDPRGCLERAHEIGQTCTDSAFQFAGVKVSLMPIDPAS